MEHRIVAGAFTHAGRTAIAYYCPETRRVTWQAKDRANLIITRGTPELTVESMLKAWLA